MRKKTQREVPQREDGNGWAQRARRKKILAVRASMDFSRKQKRKHNATNIILEAETREYNKRRRDRDPEKYIENMLAWLESKGAL